MDKVIKKVVSRANDAIKMLSGHKTPQYKNEYAVTSISLLVLLENIRELRNLTDRYSQTDSGESVAEALDVLEQQIAQVMKQPNAYNKKVALNEAKDLGLDVITGGIAACVKALKRIIFKGPQPGVEDALLQEQEFQEAIGSAGLILQLTINAERAGNPIIDYEKVTDPQYDHAKNDWLVKYKKILDDSLRK